MKQSKSIIISAVSGSIRTLSMLSSVPVSPVMGFNVRARLEVSVPAGKGRLAEPNAEQMHQAHGIEGLGFEVATADEAREILSLDGQDKIAF